MVKKKTAKHRQAGRKVGKKLKVKPKTSRSIRTFNVDDDFYDRFKIYCAANGFKMSVVFDELLIGLLDEVESD